MLMFTVAASPLSETRPVRGYHGRVAMEHPRPRHHARSFTLRRRLLPLEGRAGTRAPGAERSKMTRGLRTSPSSPKRPPARRRASLLPALMPMRGTHRPRSTKPRAEPKRCTRRRRTEPPSRPRVGQSSCHAIGATAPSHLSCCSEEIGRRAK